MNRSNLNCENYVLQTDVLLNSVLNAEMRSLK
jgi:hypothetical protein